MLDAKHLKYDIARNGQIEVELLKRDLEKTCCNTRYKLIITDINMPILDGYDAAIKINQLIRDVNLDQKQQIYIPIVAMTAYEYQFIEEKLSQSGIAGYLQKKHYMDDELTEVLHKYYH